ncbi:asparagine synthase-related protein [Thermodesulfobacteriota bacterium]
MTIITTHHQGFVWHCRAGVRTKGYLFDGTGTFRRGEKLLAYFSAVTDAGNFCSKLREAMGCFAVIVETDRHMLAAVDPVRSMPLFYAIKNNDLVLGDDVYAIQQELGGAAEIDPVAHEEFLRVGYTVGPRTIDPRVGQIEAGEFYDWNKPTARGGARLYFSHAHGNYTDKNENVLVEELDQVTSRWARRLIESVEGRTIVIPLSGGYDSRYIACGLKRAGYANVICYSYGTSASYEWHVAQDVASRLGYPIHIVEYNRQNWQTTIESPRFLEYCRFAAQHCAVPHIQDLSACEILIRQGAFPDDAVVVPGYCGDLQGGSYVPAGVMTGQSKKVLAEGINNYLFQTLFNLRCSETIEEMKLAILRRIAEYTSHTQADDIQDFCSVLEDWFTRHKVSKFVVNSLRVYEHFGNEWRLPLWDNELIGWWYRIPLKFRANSTLYHRFLFERLFNPMNVAFRKPRSYQVPTTTVKRWLPPAVLPAVQWLYRRTLCKYYRKRNDIDAFDDVSRILIEQLPGKWTLDDFGNVNGAVAVWCDAHGL